MRIPIGTLLASMLAATLMTGSAAIADTGGIVEVPMQPTTSETLPASGTDDDAAVKETTLETATESDEAGLEAMVGGAAGETLRNDHNQNCDLSFDAGGVLVVKPVSGDGCVYETMPDSFLRGLLDNNVIVKDVVGGQHFMGVTDALKDKFTGLRFERGVKAHTHFHPFSFTEGYPMWIPTINSLDLSNVDFSDTTDLSFAFEGMRLQGDADIRIDASKLEDTRYMFLGSSMTGLKVGLDTRNVTNMAEMFAGMSNLKTLDISALSNAKADCTDMFARTTGINTFTIGAGWDTSKAGALPMSPTGRWWSAASKKWVTNEEMASVRSHVADTYTSFRVFPDVAAGTWYVNVVSRAADLNLISGYNDGRFGPNDKITRGQVAVILWNMSGNPAAKANAKRFGDVEASKYYSNAISWASSAGVVNGYNTGKFGPDDPVTREQLTAMLANYMRNVASRKVVGSRADYAGMSDAAKVSDWAEASVGWCFKNGILNGTKDGRVNPKGNATRAEAAKMILKEHDLLA